MRKSYENSSLNMYKRDRFEPFFVVKSAGVVFETGNKVKTGKKTGLHAAEMFSVTPKLYTVQFMCKMKLKVNFEHGR